MRRGTPVGMVAAACLAASLFSADARAQIVNVQSILVEPARPGLSGSVATSADWRRGNSDLSFINLAGVARYARGQHLGILVARAEHKRSAGDQVVDYTFAHARYRYSWRPRIMAEAFAQHGFDDVARLHTRALLGVGPRFMLYRADRFQAELGTAYMLEFELLADDGQSDGGTARLYHRGSLYLVANLRLGDGVQFLQTFYAQPRIRTVKDTRYLANSELALDVTEALTISISLSMEYDTRPPVSIEKFNRILLHTVIINF